MELGNYKIKVTTEAESKEAQELFFALGYYWNTGLGVKNFGAKFLFVKNNQITMGFCSDNFSDSDSCELTLHQLRDLVAQSKNKQCLISGADALRALADGKEVELQVNGDINWHDSTQWTVGELLTFKGVFRLKPRTITLNIEIPAPFEPKDKDNGYVIDLVVSSNPWNESDPETYRVGAWRTEEEIKQVVAALRGALKNG